MKRTEKSKTLAKRLSRDYLLLSVIPLLALFVITMVSGISARNHVGQLIDGSIENISAEARKQLIAKGEANIRSRAREVSIEIERFLRSQQKLNLSALLRTPEFLALSFQNVGSTGYTWLFEAESGIVLLHPNIDFFQKDIRFLSEKLPAFWSLFSSSLSGRQVSGYYEWEDSDGRFRQKFMAITPVYLPVQGKTLMIAATIYIDEFFEPIQFMEKKQQEVRAEYHNYMVSQTYVSAISISIVLVLTLLAISVVNRRIANRLIYPIKTLSDAAEEFGKRNQWTIDENSSISARVDEIGALARSFTRMGTQIESQIEKIKESESKFRNAFENANVGICLVGLDGTLKEANAAFANMIGRSPAEIVGENVTNYTHPEDLESRSEFVSDLINGKNKSGVGERRFFHRDGSVVFTQISARVQCNNSGIPDYFISLVQDITERKKTEEELRLAHYCVKHAALGIMRIADDATILDANQHACQSLCYTRDELLHMTVFDIDDRLSKEQWTEHRCSLANIGAKTIETTHRRKDGTLIPVQVTINYLKHGEEGFSFYFVTDISNRVNAERERERLESQLRQAQKMEAIGSLAGGIAHDFNNILSVILGNTEILQMEEYFREQDKKFLEQIRNAGERAKQLVRQILTFSRQGKQQRVLVNLKPLIKETFEFLRSSLPATIELKNNVCSDPALIFADPTQMQQILMNLCTNASHAMEKQGGVLTVSLENYCIGQEESEIEPDAGHGEYVRLSVEDTGNGIEPWVLNRIFDPYFTTKEPGKGTGLGLAVVHGIVKAQGGKIKVISQVGQGAIFHIFLPRAEGLEKYEPKVVHTLSTGTERVLFIDDETPLVDLGKLILERLGYQVETRTSPLDGLEAFRANPLRFDVVITDMTMPQLTGATLAKEMLRIRPDIPIILCSGYSDQINEAKAQSLGIKSYLLKPLTAQDLSEAVRGVL